jgi:hypothetical protein
LKKTVIAKQEDKNNREKSASWVLFFVSLAVFMASSVWFSGTAAGPILKTVWQLNHVQMAWLTVAVQLGFITGTFLYSIFNLADIFRARHVFFFQLYFVLSSMGFLHFSVRILDQQFFFGFLQG